MLILVSFTRKKWTGVYSSIIRLPENCTETQCITSQSKLIIIPLPYTPTTPPYHWTNPCNWTMPTQLVQQSLLIQFPQPRRIIIWLWGTPWRRESPWQEGEKADGGLERSQSAEHLCHSARGEAREDIAIRMLSGWWRTLDFNSWIETNAEEGL